MTENKAVSIQVALDVTEIERQLDVISGGLISVEMALSNLSSSVISGFSSVNGMLAGVGVTIGMLLQLATVNCKQAVKEGSDGIVVEGKNILKALNELQEMWKEDQISNASSKGVDWTFSLIDLMKGQKGLGETTSPQFDGFPGQLALPPAGGTTGSTGNKNGGGDSAASGIVGSMLGGAESFLPDAESMEALSQSIGNVAAKLKESAAAWTLQMGAKIADKAVDLQIIALYALDYVKAFGKMVGQIALGTAAWITDTAAKVANTAAQWAQVAATTAWNALCAVATTVTTAFGAAMTFLTSPIFVAVK